MIKRRVIRAGVVFNRTQYFIDKGAHAAGMVRVIVRVHDRFHGQLRVAWIDCAEVLMNALRRRYRFGRIDHHDSVVAHHEEVERPRVAEVATRTVAGQSGSDRGSPNQPSTLLSKRVHAQIRSPARVSTMRPVPWRMPVELRR